MNIQQGQIPQRDARQYCHSPHNPLYMSVPAAQAVQLLPDAHDVQLAGQSTQTRLMPVVREGQVLTGLRMPQRSQFGRAWNRMLGHAMTPVRGRVHHKQANRVRQNSARVLAPPASCRHAQSQSDAVQQTHTYTHDPFARARSYASARRYASARTHTHTMMYACTHARMRARTHEHMHACTHAHIRARAHAQTCTHTPEHKLTPSDAYREAAA